MVVPLRNDMHTALWGWITTGRTHGNCRQMGRYHAGPRDCLSSKSDGVSVRVWGGVEETDRVRPVSSKLPRLCLWWRHTCADARGRQVATEVFQVS